MATTLEKLEELVYRGFEETDRRMEEADRDLRRRREESDKDFRRRMKESDKRFKEDMRRLSKQVTDVSDPLGRFAESAVFPAVIPLFKKRGIRINQLWGNFPAVKKGEEMQLDIAGIGDDFALAIDVKMRLKQEYVEEFLQKKLSRVFELFPLLQRPILYGGVAAMTVDPQAERFAYKQGLFILKQSGYNVRIMNDKAFRPRSFDSFQTNGAHKTKKR